MPRRLVFLLSLVALIVASTAAATGSLAARPGPAPAGLYPDLRAVVPQQVQLVNQQQREWAALLERHRQHGRRGRGPCARSPPHGDRHGGRQRRPGDP